MRIHPKVPIAALNIPAGFSPRTFWRAAIEQPAFWTWSASIRRPGRKLRNARGPEIATRMSESSSFCHTNKVRAMRESYSEM